MVPGVGVGRNPLRCPPCLGFRAVKDLVTDSLLLSWEAAPHNYEVLTSERGERLVREGGTEGGRERQTDRQTETERQRETETDRQAGRQAGRQTDR